jgi:hypothetical protein
MFQLNNYSIITINAAIYIKIIKPIFFEYKIFCTH